MDGLQGDLQAKYQKLASEYSKIRAQATVLKKAVVDEQLKSSELKDILKEKDQCLRKADQEMESLTFRNQQLTKRVTVLQEELDMMQTKAKKGKIKVMEGHEQSVISSSLIDEQLEKMVHENARLSSLLQEREEDHSRMTQQLMERVQNLELEVQQFQRTTTDVESKYKAQLQELQLERARLSEKVEERERDVQQYSAQVAALQLQQERLQADLGGKLQSASDIISVRLPFVDSEHHELNALNVPTHNQQQQAWSFQLVGQIGRLICDLTSQLSDLHTYTEQRLHAISDSLSPIATKLSAYLRENARYLRGLEQGYKEFQAGLDHSVIISLETISSLVHFADRLETYGAYVQKLLPYQLFSLEEERAHSGEALKCHLQRLHYHMLAFANCFAKLSTYVSLLAQQSKKRKQHPHACQKRFFDELLLAVESLHLCISDMASVYKLKSQLERDLSSSTERLHSTNECLVNCLASMECTTKELHTVLLDNRANMLKERKLKGTNTPIKTHPAVADFKSRASSYLKYLEQDEPPSVPYEIAIQQQAECAGGASSREALGEQLRSVAKHATKVEQEREHWQQEYQLLHMRHVKEQQRTRELEEQLQLSRSSATTPQSEDSCGEVARNVGGSPAHSNGSGQQPVNAVVTALLGQVTCPLQCDPEMQAREEEVKKYFAQRINQLVADRQFSEGKTVSLRAECAALHERLQLAIEQRSIAERRMVASEKSLALLQEELHTTSHNYEAQLSTMSEHLAHMNERLTAQKDEIDQLKYQLGQKVAKKGKK